MKKSIVLSAGSAVAASALMALFGTGVAAADDYAGQTYADASSAASDAGADCRRRQPGGRQGGAGRLHRARVRRPHRSSMATTSRTSRTQVQFNLNCNGGYATANTPGPSLASPEGREAKAAADEAAAEEQQTLEEVSTPDQ